MTTALTKLGTHLADFLWPPQCLSCRAPVSDPRSLCGDCWSAVTFLEPPLCQTCGRPFDFDVGESVCAACMADPPAYEAARAVMKYDDVARSLTLGLKHGDRQEGVPAFARWLMRAGRDVIGAADVIVPVPLHRRRLFARRFNQAALMARSLGKATGIAGMPDALVRRRATPSQGGLGRKGRVRNVQGAFALHPDRGEAVKDRSVLLIDDVFTTGATVEACARTLLRGGAGRVFVLTLARVVQAESPPI